MQVADVMTPNPVTVTPATAIQTAVQILADRRIGALPVVDDAGTLVGVLSEQELMERQSGVAPRPFVMFLDLIIYLENPKDYTQELHRAFGETVAEVMSSTFVAITVDEPLPVAAQKLAQKNCQRLLVTDAAGQLVGIITRGDIVRAMAA